MIILRNNYYSSPYYGGGYDDLEERLYFDTRKVAGATGEALKGVIGKSKGKLPRAERQRLRQEAHQLNRFANGKGFTGKIKARVDSGLSSERDVVRRSMGHVTAAKAGLDNKVEKMVDLDSIMNRNVKNPLGSRWDPKVGTLMGAEQGYMQRLGKR